MAYPYQQYQQQYYPQQYAQYTQPYAQPAAAPQQPQGPPMPLAPPPKRNSTTMIGLAIIIVLLVAATYYFYTQNVTAQSNLDQLALALSLQSDDVSTMLTQAQQIKANSDQLAAVNAKLTADDTKLTADDASLAAANVNLATDTATLAQLNTTNATLQTSIAKAQATTFTVDDYLLQYYVGQDATLLSALRDIRNEIIREMDSGPLADMAKIYKINQIATMLQKIVTLNANLQADPNGQCSNAADIVNRLIQSYSTTTPTYTITQYVYANGSLEYVIMLNDMHIAHVAYNVDPPSNTIYQVDPSIYANIPDTLQLQTPNANAHMIGAADISSYKPSWGKLTAINTTQQTLALTSPVATNQVYTLLTTMNAQITTVIGYLIGKVCTNMVYNQNLATALARKISDTVFGNTAAGIHSTTDMAASKAVDYMIGPVGSYVLPSYDLIAAIKNEPAPS